MTDILDRLAGGGGNNFVGGLGKIADTAQQRFQVNKQLQQENQFNKQKLGISKSRLDLDKLVNAQNRSQQRAANAIKKSEIKADLAKTKTLQNKNIINESIRKSKLVGRDLDNAIKRTGIIGSNAKGLIDGYQTEIERAAAYDVMLPKLKEIDPTVPDSYPGEEWLQDRMSTASLAISAFKAKQLDQEEDISLNKAQAERIIQSRTNIPDELKPVIRGMDADSLSNLAEEVASVKGVEAKQQKELNFLNGVASSSQMFLAMDELESLPGREAYLGVGSLLKTLPGSDAEDFGLKLEQFRAQNFAENIKLLRGFGALSDMEGVKIEGLIAVLSKTQSDTSFLKNLKNTRSIVKNSLLIKWKNDNPKIKNLESVKYLMDNPTREVQNEFKRKFGSLPNGWFFIKETLFKDSASMKRRNNEIQSSKSTLFKPGDRIPMRDGPDKVMGFNGERLSTEEFDDQAVRRDPSLPQSRRLQVLQPQDKLNPEERQNTLSQ